MTSTLAEVIKKQLKISKMQTKLLRHIKKLDKLPIEVEHLRQTGVANTINSLRMFSDELNVAAQTLAIKWMALESNNNESASDGSDDNSNTTSDKEVDDKENNEEREDKSLDLNKNQMEELSNASLAPKHDETYSRSSSLKENQKQPRFSKENKTKSEYYSLSSTSESEDSDSDDTKSSITQAEKARTDEDIDLIIHDNLVKTSHTLTSATSSSKNYTTIQNNCKINLKRRHDAANDSWDLITPQPKIAKLQNFSSGVSSSYSTKVEERIEGGIDMSMGINFDEVLNMLNAPIKKSHKSAKSRPSHSTKVINTTKEDAILKAGGNGNASSLTNLVSALSDSETLTHSMTSKTIRTKIYSGVQNSGFLTQKHFWIKKLKTQSGIGYVGDVPFTDLEPVLVHAKPEDLNRFEEQNPNIAQETDILWKQYVSRKYPTQEHKNNESWREMFKRCQAEEDCKLQMLNNKIKIRREIAEAPIKKVKILDSTRTATSDILKQNVIRRSKANSVATPTECLAPISCASSNTSKCNPDKLKTSSRSNCMKKAPLMKKALQQMRSRLTA